MTGTTVKEYMERINLGFYAMIGLPMLLFAWVYLPLKDQLSWSGGTTASTVLAATYVTGSILLAGPIWGIVKTKGYEKAIDPRDTLSAKLAGYRGHWQRAYLGIMFAALCAVLMLFMTKNLLFVTIYALLLFLVSLYRPTIDRLIRYLPLTEEELSIVKDQREIV